MDSSGIVQLQNDNEATESLCLLDEVVLMDKKELRRPLPKFRPDIWGEQFLDYTPPDKVTQNQNEEEAKKLKELVRNQLVAVIKDPKEKLEYVDAILRLGVAYHFEKEIEDILQIFHNNLNCDDDCYEDDFHYVSLRFRLLRLHGFHVSCDVFTNFKCENGKFKDCLADDMEGILSLYEASDLRVHGETKLDEALVFATTCLTSFATTQLSSPMAEQIAHSLKLPLHKRSARLESRYQISFYESKPSHDNTLLRFAKLDFNLLQVLHKMELKDLTRWWRNFDAIVKLPKFARDRTVETYFWILSFYHEPGYAYARMCSFKMIKIITIIDDMYDSYGSINDLIIFTNAMERWDKSCKDQLPEYMQLFYEAILDTFEEFEQDLRREDRSFAVYYTREQLKTGCQAYLQEAKWCHDEFVPTYDEYIENALKTANCFYLLCAIFLGMGKIATKEAFEWVVHINSKGPTALCMYGRLMDDLAGHKGEIERGAVSTAVECYMKEFGTSEEETYKVIQCRLEETWKEINEAMLQPNTSIPRALLNRFLNLSRVLNDLYEIGKDAYTEPKYLQPKVKAILVDPIVM